MPRLVAEDRRTHGGDPTVFAVEPLRVGGRRDASNSSRPEIRRCESGYYLEDARELEDGESMRVHAIPLRQNPDERGEFVSPGGSLPLC
jgi:hypothetical protein